MKALSIILGILAFLSIVVFFLIFFENKQKTYHPGGPYFYKSFANYKVPIQLEQEISQEEAMKLEKEGYAYYEAYFNQEGLIEKYIKRYQGKIVLEKNYFYKKGKLINQETKKFPYE